jgi:hypothetical protein
VRHALRRLLPASSAIVLAAGCGGHSASVDGLGVPLDRPVTQRELLALPDSSLLYPTSHLIRRVGADEQAQPGDHEPDPAYAGVIATASVSAAALLAWYDRTLTARGYLRATYYRQSNQVDGAAWTVPNSKEQIQVGIFASTAEITGSAPHGSLAYQQMLVNYRVTGPPPS